MDNERTPGALGSNDGLGPLPEDALRQQAFLILSRLQSGTEDVVRLDAALAAVAAERERCAGACDDEARLWEADGKGPAAEARLCAARIRSLA